MNPDQQLKKYKFIPWIFAIFFCVFIIVDIAYIIIAEKTWRGLSTEDGYQKGLKYNQTIKSVQEQKELGWQLKIKYQSTASKIGILQVKLLDKNNQIITNANLTTNIKRPVQEGKDFTIQLKFNPSTATYDAPINFPLIGQWDIEVEAQKNKDIYQDIKRLVIK